MPIGIAVLCFGFYRFVNSFDPPLADYTQPTQTIDVPESPLDIAISQAIIASDNYTHLEYAYPTESHIILKTDENENSITAYVMAYSAAFSYLDSKLLNVGGSHMPVAITFEKGSDGAYNLVEYWIPDDGAYYISSIQARFPKDIWDKIDTQHYVENQILKALRNAQSHFGITDFEKPEIRIIKPLVLDKGSKPNWEDYISIIDDTDGEIDFSEAYIWDVMIDFNKSGEYPLHIIVEDNAGNENRSLDNKVTVK